MKKEKNKKLAAEWFKIGDNEFCFAKAAFEELGAFYPQICFQCHQAAEKYLKGFLVYHNINSPKIHDLAQLVKLCAKIDRDFLEILEEANVLSQYYIVCRYPLEYPAANREQAQEALETADKLMDLTREKVNTKI